MFDFKDLLDIYLQEEMLFYILAKLTQRSLFVW